MIEGLLLALALAAGADWRPVAMAAGATWAPMPALVALTGAAVIGRRIRVAASAGEEARFVESVVGELRAGSSLRSALRTSSAGIGGCSDIVRRLDVGDPLAVGVAGLGHRLPTIGALVESAVAAGPGGGRMLAVFEELVVLAAAADHAREELRVATAQVRASLWLLVGGPSVYMSWSVATGRLQALLQLPGGKTVATVGAGLFLAGVGIMAWMGRK